jgi:hypothetical protein
MDEIAEIAVACKVVTRADWERISAEFERTSLTSLEKLIRSGIGEPRLYESITARLGELFIRRMEIAAAATNVTVDHARYFHVHVVEESETVIAAVTWNIERRRQIREALKILYKKDIQLGFITLSEFNRVNEGQTCQGIRNA